MGVLLFSRHLGYLLTSLIENQMECHLKLNVTYGFTMKMNRKAVCIGGMEVAFFFFFKASLDHNNNSLCLLN